MGEMSGEDPATCEARRARISMPKISRRLWDRPPQRSGMVYGKLDRLGDGYYYLGRSHLLQDEDDRAIADYERAIKIVGENSPRGQVIKEELKILRNRKR